MAKITKIINEQQEGENYPSNWWHGVIHLKPETGEMHGGGGDLRTYEWIKNRIEQQAAEIQQQAEHIKKLQAEAATYYTEKVEQAERIEAQCDCIEALKGIRTELEAVVLNVVAAANKVVLSFPAGIPKDAKEVDFNIPAYVINDLREAVKAAAEKEQNDGS